MDFTLAPETEDLRRRLRAFVDSEIIPLESDPASYDAHENIALEKLTPDVIAAGNVTGSGTVTGSVFAGGTVDTSNITVAGSVFQNMATPPTPCQCTGGIVIDAPVAGAPAPSDNRSRGACPSRGRQRRR